MGHTNFCSFQKNALGTFNLVILDEKYTSPQTPYVLSIEEQCNPILEIRTPLQPKSSFTGDLYVNAQVIPEKIKTYYVLIPRGANFGNEPTKENAEKDAELWCAWRQTFGFKRIPIDFNIAFTIGIARGTRLVVSYQEFSENNNIPFVNHFDFLPSGYPLLFQDPSRPSGPLYIFRDIYVDGAGIFYAKEDDEGFKTLLPDIYKTC